MPPGKALIVPLAFLVILSFRPDGPGSGDPVRTLQLYHKADHLYQSGPPGPANDSVCLAGFEEVISRLERDPGFAGSDTLLFLSWLKKGILLDAKNDYAGARDGYCKALELQRFITPGASPTTNNPITGASAPLRPFPNDSLEFVLRVYAGTCYYNLNNFDSASYFLLRAEASARTFHDPEDEVRMYNTLGALYYANGNYQQGKNYLSRGLEILESKKPLDTASLLGIESNIATSLYRLGSYQESLAIFAKILKYGSYTSYIYMNMGRAFAGLGQYQQALYCFRKVNPAKVPAVLNEMGHTQWILGRPDSANYFLSLLSTYPRGLPVFGGGRTSFPENAVQLNQLDVGVNELYRADLLGSQRQFIPALESLQQAIRLFAHDFTNQDIYSNPSGITGTFAYYRLFEALSQKAILFNKLYAKEPKTAYLLASYDAYKTALAILRYIEKSFDTDDAKLFLKKNSSQVYEGALSVALGLHRLFPGNGYLEQAFMIGEQNKASIITAGLKERAFGAAPGSHETGAGDRTGPEASRGTGSGGSHEASTGGNGAEEILLQRERNIKYNIARLNVRGDEAQDGHELQMIAREKAGYEIELTRLQKELEQNDRYYKLKYDDSSPGIKELQGRLSGQQALISCYMTADALHLFVVTGKTFSHIRIDSLTALQHDLGSWLDLLKTVESGKKFRGGSVGTRLYQRLIKPIRALVPDKEEWIIIPDGMLYFLPFESLPADAGGGLLVETTTISYQFSSRFVMNEGNEGAGDLWGLAGTGRANAGVLGFAPFAGAGAGASGTGSVSGQSYFSRLPGSREEIAGLPGISFIDSAATKERFLSEINKYPIIHLATHAVSSVSSSSESFIAFYPQQVASAAGQGSHASDRLFLEELYGLNMSATKLVIISACETGQGELVSNEGVISLARAFTYAGCESTINSLWKADDKATSFILRQFHIYLEKGFTKSKALRQAKLDYLKSDAINKSPSYWSHLILIGNTGAVYKMGHALRWSLLAVSLCLLIGGVMIWRRREKKKSTSFTVRGF